MKGEQQEDELQCDFVFKADIEEAVKQNNLVRLEELRLAQPEILDKTSKEYKRRCNLEQLRL